MKLKTRLLAVVIALASATQGQAGNLQPDNRYADNHHRDGFHRVKKVFVIAMENHNWTQPSTQTSPQQLFHNPAAPFLNSLVNGTSGISNQVAYANAYINAAVGDHPSEPNYLWAEAGTNFGVKSDNNPYHADCTPDTVQTSKQHLSAFLTAAGKSWKSYQEDTDVDATNTPLSVREWTVPLYSKSGVYTTPGLNAYNYSNQYNYAAKHNPMVYFTDTNGGCDTSTSNRMRLQYAPLQQLALDLAKNTVADYNWISPDQYNDMHTPLANGYGQYPNSDSGMIAQADNFLGRIVPLIMTSRAYQDHGMIILWWDESEGGDDPSRTLPFIIISGDVRRNLNGVPYSNMILYSHSSFVRTMQKVFDIDPRHGYPWLGDAANATDLSDLLKPGAIR
jgi:hypothetical protein